MTTKLQLEEITFLQFTPTYETTPCPHCQQMTVRPSSIPCPDNIPGCCVAHYGYVCDSCRSVFIGERGNTPRSTQP